MKATTVILMLVGVAAACGCASQRKTESHETIKAGSMSRLETTSGTRLDETWLSRMNGSYTLTVYDTSQPADSATGLCPVAAVLTGTFTRQDSTTMERHDSLQLVAVRTDSVDVTSATKEEVARGSAATPFMTRLSHLFWALAALVAAVTVGFLLWRIRRIT